MQRICQVLSFYGDENLTNVTDEIGWYYWLFLEEGISILIFHDTFWGGWKTKSCLINYFY
jgi:hypothetical protein